MCNSRYRILPYKLFCRDLRPKIACFRSHIPVSEFEPSPCKCILKFIRIFQKTSCNFFISRIKSERKVGCKHHWCMTFIRIVGIRYSICSHTMFWFPLMSAGWTFRQFPFITKKVPEEVIGPPCRCCGPGSLQTACNSITGITFPKGVFPSESLFLNTCRSRFRSNMLAGIGSSMCLPEGMTAGNKCNSLLIIHCHPSESFTNITGSSQRIRNTVRTFRIDINQTHLNSSQRIFKIPVTRITVIFKPLTLRSPVNVLLRFPDILPSSTETENFEAHRFHCTVPCKYHQISP